MERPDMVVRRAEQARWFHYANKGAKPLPWSSLTDAQKLPWLLRATQEKSQEDKSK